MNGGETAERLIEATRELLWERGYVGTSPRAIQQRAEAGQGSMYHHFDGKPALARAAVRRSAEGVRARADADLSVRGSARERVRGYLLRERAVLRGCQVGGLSQDPEVVADPELRAPLEETFAWLRGRLTRVLEEGRDSGEFGPELDTSSVAAAIVAVVQGGYVMARAAGDSRPFQQAAEGLLALLDVAAAQPVPTVSSDAADPSATGGTPAVISGTPPGAAG